jgi:chitodextrinase
LRGRVALGVAFVLIAAVLLPAAAGASITPDTIDFGAVTTNHSTVVTVTNDSTHDWVMGTPSFEDGSAYSVTHTDCIYVFTFWPVNQCEVTIQFNGLALAPGQYSDTLDVPYTNADDSAPGMETVSVTGSVNDHDATPPSIPQNLHVTALTPTGVTLAWTAATDDHGVAGYHVLEFDGSAWSTLTVTPGTSFSIAGLDPGSSHRYAVAAYDSAGNVSAMSQPVDVTTPVPPPSPQNVTAVAALSTVAFTWDAPGVGDSTFDYRVERLNGGVWKSEATVEAPATGAVVSGLSPHTAYSFRVLAEDENGLTSDPVLLAVTTLSDTTAPTMPVLSAHGTTSAGTHLQWTPATDDVGVSSYRLSTFEDGTWVPLGTPLTTSSYAVSGLDPSTTYTFGVVAVDAAGNVSARSSVAVTTDHAPRFTQLPRVAFVNGSTVTKSLVPTRISWATDAASRCKTEVGRESGSAWTGSTLSNPQATSFDWRTSYKVAHAARVAVVDCAGTSSGWSQTPTFSPAIVGGAAITFSKGWSTVHGAAYLGGGEQYGARSGLSVTARITSSRAVAFVGSCGSSRGTARIYLDGNLSATLNEHCSGGVGRVLYTHTWAASGSHTLKIVTAGAKRFDVDGFIGM